MSAQGKWRIRSDAAGFNCKVDDAAGRLMASCSTFEIARAVVAAHNAQCEAEPVGWQWRPRDSEHWQSGKIPTYVDARWCEERPLYTVPPPPASAVAKVEELRDADAQTALAAKDARIAELEENAERHKYCDETIASLKDRAISAEAIAACLEAQLQAARAAGTREDGLREAAEIASSEAKMWGPEIGSSAALAETRIRARLTAPAEPTADTGEKG